MGTAKALPRYVAKMEKKLAALATHVKHTEVELHKANILLYETSLKNVQKVAALRIAIEALRSPSSSWSEALRHLKHLVKDHDDMKDTKW